MVRAVRDVDRDEPFLYLPRELLVTIYSQTIRLASGDVRCPRGVSLVAGHFSTLTFLYLSILYIDMLTFSHLVV